MKQERDRRHTGVSESLLVSSSSWSNVTALEEFGALLLVLHDQAHAIGLLQFSEIVIVFLAPLGSPNTLVRPDTSKPPRDIFQCVQLSSHIVHSNECQRHNTYFCWAAKAASAAKASSSFTRSASVAVKYALHNPPSLFSPAAAWSLSPDAATTSPSITFFKAANYIHLR